MKTVSQVKKLWLILRVLLHPLYWRVTPFQFRFRIHQSDASDCRRNAREAGSSAATDYLRITEGAASLVSVTVGDLHLGQLSGRGCRLLFRGEDLHLLRASQDILKGF